MNCKFPKILLMVILLLGLVGTGIVFSVAAASENSNTLVIAHSEYAWTFDPVCANWWDIGRPCMVA